MKKKLLNADKYPAKCEYCLKGRPSPDGENVLCVKNGIVPKNSSCRAYKYDVMKRCPAKPAAIESVDPEDFKI